MKKIFILAGFLAIVTPSSTMLAAARNQPLDTFTPRHHSRFLRALSSCFSVKRPTIALDTVYKGLEIILEADRNALREIYLVCQRPGCTLSDATIDLLQQNGFLDDGGNFQTGWKKHVKHLLTHNGSNVDAEGFNFMQCIQDLIAKHPKIADELEGALAGTNTYAPSTALLLNEQYGLTLPTRIKDHELQRIGVEIRRQKNSVRADHKQPPYFRIMNLDEALSREGYSEIFF